MTISEEQLWSLAFEDGTFLDAVFQAPGLRPLVESVEFATLETTEPLAEAGLDDQEPGSTLIWIATGLHDELVACLQSALDSVETLAWTKLGWPEDAFADRAQFLDYLTSVAMDFIVAHELGHVVRGHVDRYCAMGIGLADLAEARSNPPPEDGITTLRRQALELDADSIALYFLVTLAPHLREYVPRYQRMPSIQVYVATLSFCVRVTFAMFSVRDTEIDASQTLEELHAVRWYPHPNVRSLYADQRVLQLAVNHEEEAVYREAIELSQQLFIACVSADALPFAVLGPELEDFGQTTSFMNRLIAEVQLIDTEEWSHETRLTRSLDAVRRELEGVKAS